MNPSQAAYLVLMVYGLLLLVILLYLYIKSMSRDLAAVAGNTQITNAWFQHFAERIHLAASKDKPCGCEEGKDTIDTPAPGGEA